MVIKNNITNNDYSDEWYTPKSVVEKAFSIFPCKASDRILMPFDSEKSEFVKVAKERGYNIVYNIKDFLTRDYEFDYLITNPPFSIKDKVIERCVELKRPATLILPIDSLGGGETPSIIQANKYKSFYPYQKNCLL